MAWRGGREEVANDRGRKVAEIEITNNPEAALGINDDKWRVGALATSDQSAIITRDKMATSESIFQLLII